MEKKTYTNLSLLENAYNFISESISQYNKSKKDSKKWPFAIFLIIQGLELLMKQVLKEEHPLFIYENIDKPRNTITITQALERLISISKDTLDEKEICLIKKAINYRNKILHYEISFNNNEFKIIYSQLFEFLHYFHKRHFNTDLHKKIPENLWKSEADLMISFEKETAFYNGIEVHKSTPLEIIKYQKYDGLLFKNKLYNRIRYGDENNPRNSDACNDCGCLKGQFHTEGCDVEQCPICGEQFLGCSCSYDNELFYVNLKNYKQ